ncbi:MAG: cation-translocating P-type ATPase [Anaerolineae bacterium]|nr:cation-translocating P-type ATPase [Anaerolineae bacterium]
MTDDTNNAWHSQPIPAVLDALQTHRTQGLTLDEATARLEKHGPNELREAPRPGFLTRLINQFRNFVVIILIVASVLSLFLGDFIEAAAIIAIVILNAILGVVQESRAEKALAALKKLAAPEAEIIREGRQQKLPARELVPGDIVLLETGNYIPADVRLVEAVNLKIEEAALTGESVPTEKRADVVLDREIPLGDRRNTAYMSTVVTYGRGRGVVVATGMSTQIGLIAQMIQSYEEEPTPLQVKLDQLGKTLGWAALVICGLVFVVGIIQRRDPLEMFLTAVSLAIAAVPEGLPAIVTICLALGMQRMIRRHALLRRLPAVETLGSATAICSDKTGTLTQNQMTAVQLYTDNAIIRVSGEGYQPQGEFSLNGGSFEVREHGAAQLLLRCGLLCNDAFLESSGREDSRVTYRMVGDPTEGALVVAAAKSGLWKTDEEEHSPRVAEVPFDSERKRMSTIHRPGAAHFANPLDPYKTNGPTPPYVVCTKGAPDLVLDLCTTIYKDEKIQPITEADRQAIRQVNHDMASQALRVLGAAFRPLDALPTDTTPETVEKELTFVGLFGLIDPPRPEVKPAIVQARQAGIKTVMITGDYQDTAVAIAQQIGLLRPQGKVLTGRDLDRMSDVELTKIADDVDVYARVSPQHKVKIVEALKARGHVAAMTGDGVNDAPALKRSSIGVAMGITGTDVSKETADMVLTDDNYASIVAAVEEGRVIYSNIRKFVFYLLSANIAEILIIFISIIAGLPLPLTALELLVLNLITDGAPALALGLEKGDPDIMQQPPRPTNEPVINRDMLWGIVFLSIADTFITLTSFSIGLRWFPDNLFAAETMAFATLTFSELLRAYGARSERQSLFTMGIFTNRWMQVAVASSAIILLAIIYLPFLQPVFDSYPLSLREWTVILPLLFVPVTTLEIVKFFLRRASRRRLQSLGAA